SLAMRSSTVSSPLSPERCPTARVLFFFQAEDGIRDHCVTGSSDVCSSDLEALLAVLTAGGVVALLIGVERVMRPDRTSLDKRLRRYGGRAYQLTDEEQKQAASQQVTQMLAKRVEASISGRTFAAALPTDLARAHLRLTVSEV